MNQPPHEAVPYLKETLLCLLHQIGIEGEWFEFEQDPYCLYFVRAGESDAAASFRVVGETVATRYLQMSLPAPVNSVHEGEITWNLVLHTQNLQEFLIEVGVRFARTKLTRYVQTKGRG